MSRTRKGSKGPGWEPWSNRHEKAEQRADYIEPSRDPWEDDICQGCRLCLCVRCGGHMGHAVMREENGEITVDPRNLCISCGHEEKDDD